MNTALAAPVRNSSKRTVRRNALDALTVTLDVARAGGLPAHLIRGWRSRSVFILLEDGSQACVSVSGDYSELLVQHARGRERAGEGSTLPVGLSADRIRVAGAASSADLATRVLCRINERQRQKASVTPDLPYVALGSF